MVIQLGQVRFLSVPSLYSYVVPFAFHLPPYLADPIPLHDGLCFPFCCFRFVSFRVPLSRVENECATKNDQQKWSFELIHDIVGREETLLTSQLLSKVRKEK
jgi:hypothetical protein